MKKTYIKPETKVYTLLAEPLLNTGSISDGETRHYVGLEDEWDGEEGGNADTDGWVWGD